MKMITESDSAALSEILEIAYEDLQGKALENLVVSGMKVPRVIGLSGVCIEASDASTRAAHSLGIVASREAHFGHYITSFAPIDALPSEDDLVLCLTWGQFDPYAYYKDPRVFFGVRKDMSNRIPNAYYRDYYGSQSIRMRQVTHSRPRDPRLEHSWLMTTPGQLVREGYPVGEVPPDIYPDELWDKPVLLFGDEILE